MKVNIKELKKRAGLIYNPSTGVFENNKYEFWKCKLGFIIYSKYEKEQVFVGQIDTVERLIWLLNNVAYQEEQHTRL